MTRMKTTFAGGLLALLLASPAFAYHCPVDARAIDNALERSTLSDSKKAEIRTLRDQGMEQHNNGNHRDAVDTLAQAMRMLLEGGLRK